MTLTRSNQVHPIGDQEENLDLQSIEDKTSPYEKSKSSSFQYVRRRPPRDGAVERKGTGSERPRSCLNRVSRTFARVDVEFSKRRNKPSYGRSVLDDPSTKVFTCCSGFRYRQRLRLVKWKASWREFSGRMEVWRGAFKTIEGNFGTGVVSYFTFLKWLFFLNVYIFVLLLLLVVIPQVTFISQPYDAYVAGSTLVNGSNAASELATNCSSQYTITVDSTDIGQLILDALQGTGWMEKKVLFYGFFEARRLQMFTLFGHVWYYNMPLAYLTVSLSAFLISLVLMVKYTARSMRENMLSSEDQYYKYCAAVFGGWDYSLETEKAVSLKHKSLYNELAGELQEEKETERRNSRKGCKKCGIYTIRLLVNVFVLGVLGGSGYLIAYATLQSQAFTERSDYSSMNKFVKLLVEYVPSLTITFLNILVPMVFSAVVKLEDYRTESQIKFTLIRTVFLRLASVAVILGTMYVQVTCTTVRDYCNVGVASSCPALRCWETYIGQQIYKLVIMDFLVVVVLIIFVEFPRRLIVTKCSCKLAKMVGQQQFNIPKNVLDLVYSQVLCWLGVFFSPLLPAICVAKSFIIFYMKMLTVLVNYIPSSQPYRASRSNMFFMVILIISFVGCCLPVGFVIWTLEPSHGCGPFRIHSRDYDIWNITIATFPDVVQTVFQILSSTTFFVCTLLVVVMALYYVRHLASAYKDMVAIMREQLAMEGKDKQFLLSRITELTGEKTQSLRQRRVTSARSAKMPQQPEQPEKEPLP